LKVAFQLTNTSGWKKAFTKRIFSNSKPSNVSDAAWQPAMEFIASLNNQKERMAAMKYESAQRHRQEEEFPTRSEEQIRRPANGTHIFQDPELEKPSWHWLPMEINIRKLLSTEKGCVKLTRAEILLLLTSSRDVKEETRRRLTRNGRNWLVEYHQLFSQIQP